MDLSPILSPNRIASPLWSVNMASLRAETLRLTSSTSTSGTLHTLCSVEAFKALEENEYLLERKLRPPATCRERAWHSRRPRATRPTDRIDDNAYLVTLMLDT